MSIVFSYKTKLELRKCTKKENVNYSLIRLFISGKVITAAYVPVTNYHNLFPDADKERSRR